MNDAQLLERLRRADAYGPDTEIPDAIWTAGLALHEIERRVGMSDKTIERTERTGPDRPSLPPKRPIRVTGTDRRRWIIGLAAAAVVVVVGLLAALLPSGGEPASTVPPTSVTTTAQETTTIASTAVTTTEAAEVNAGEAEALAQEFYADFNRGDLDAAFGVFTDDATFGFRFVGSSEEQYTRNRQFEVLAWNAGQGSQYVAPTCTVEAGGNPIVLLCEVAIFDAPAQVADLGGVPIDARLTIGDGGVEDYFETYTGQDFTTAQGRFGIWMEENHPGVLEEIDFGAWTGPDEARSDGETLATYAALWQDVLVENGCEDARFPCP